MIRLDGVLRNLVIINRTDFTALLLRIISNLILFHLKLKVGAAFRAQIWFRESRKISTFAKFNVLNLFFLKANVCFWAGIFVCLFIYNDPEIFNQKKKFKSI